MLTQTILRDIMDIKEISVTRLAEMLGLSGPSRVCDRLNAGRSTNMSTDTLDEMLRALGYKIIVVPETVELDDGWYEITSSDKSEIPEKRKRGCPVKKMREVDGSL